MSKEQKFISVVAYVHNGEDQLEDFLSSVMGKMEELFTKCELILVDDSSTDQSLPVIHRYFDSHPAPYVVSIIRMGRFQGEESSMNAGRDMAIGDYVYEFDSLVVDYDLEEIKKVYDCCLEGNDVVAAASNARQRLTSRIFYHIYNRASGAKTPIGPETFRILSRRAINRVKSLGAYIPYRKAVYMNCGLSCKVLSYDSIYGKTPGRLRRYDQDRVGLAWDSFIYFTDVMEKLSVVISAVFFVIALIVVIYIIESYFIDQNRASGWVSVMGFLSIAFVGIFGLLSIILKYLSVLVSLTFKNQRYMIEDVEKIAKN